MSDFNKILHQQCYDSGRWFLISKLTNGKHVCRRLVNSMSTTFHAIQISFSAPCTISIPRDVSHSASWSKHPSSNPFPPSLSLSFLPLPLHFPLPIYLFPLTPFLIFLSFPPFPVSSPAASGVESQPKTEFRAFSVKNLASGENNFSDVREELYRLPPCLSQNTPPQFFLWSICSNVNAV